MYIYNISKGTICQEFILEKNITQGSLSEGKERNNNFFHFNVKIYRGNKKKLRGKKKKIGSNHNQEEN